MSEASSSPVVSDPKDLLGEFLDEATNPNTDPDDVSVLEEALALVRRRRQARKNVCLGCKQTIDELEGDDGAYAFFQEHGACKACHAGHVGCVRCGIEGLKGEFLCKLCLAKKVRHCVFCLRPAVNANMCAKCQADVAKENVAGSAVVVAMPTASAADIAREEQSSVPPARPVAGALRGE